MPLQAGCRAAGGPNSAVPLRPDAQPCCCLHSPPPPAAANSVWWSMPATLSIRTRSQPQAWIWTGCCGYVAGRISHKKTVHHRGTETQRKKKKKSIRFREIKLTCEIQIRLSTDWSKSCAPQTCCSKAEASG